MTVFIDASAFVALLDGVDPHHKRAAETWSRLIASEAVLFTTNYVVLETCVVLQRRLGREVVRGFHEDIVPLLTIVWIGEEIHHASASAMFLAVSEKLSLVDCVSFHVMRQYGITAAFAFDKHFEDQGFNCNP